ncbi:hypothetical protein ACFW1M_28520 [Streptomyces inhibens]|uniref:hypothetical protein n=1 Tax=Streptomyces inhibens TaxID=2293571 RepID=UPI0036C3E2B6
MAVVQAGLGRCRPTREPGDAAHLVDTALGHLLGSEQKITVEDAEHVDEESPRDSSHWG